VHGLTARVVAQHSGGRAAIVVDTIEESTEASSECSAQITLTHTGTEPVHVQRGLTVWRRVEEHHLRGTGHAGWTLDAAIALSVLCARLRWVLQEKQRKEKRSPHTHTWRSILATKFSKTMTSTPKNTHSCRVLSHPNTTRPHSQHNLAIALTGMCGTQRLTTSAVLGCRESPIRTRPYRRGRKGCLVLGV
jgi:hypothetical protein